MRRSLQLMICALFALSLCCFLPARMAVAQGRKWVETENTKRIALVIGNADYLHGSKLTNPVNDADAMAKALRDLGFEVILRKNASRKEMIDAIGDFGEKLTTDCVGLAYYSGHGMQVDGTNYLLPVDFDARSRGDVQFNGVEANRVLAKFADRGSPVNVLILDACRNNPFKSFTRANEGGLGKMDAPRGTLIAYATAPGSVADDNSAAKNGLYTQELLKQMPVRGVKIEDMFKQVLESVADLSAEKQQPWVESSLRGSLFLAKGTVKTQDKIVDAPKIKDEDLKARLKVTTNAPGATITVDGKPAPDGSYAISLPDEATKSVRVVVKADGYEPLAKTVELERGKVLPLPLTLERMEEPVVVVPPPVNDSAKTKRNDKDGAEMMLIPAGEFAMGDSDQSDNPPHKVRLSAYYIYKNLVTVGQYEKFCSAMGKTMPDAPDFNKEWSKKDHPIVNISWEDAKAYCDWADVQLPTEAQWEKAARGTEGRKFPWGDTFDTSKLWCSMAKVGDAGGTASVNRSDRLGKSPYGVLDMAGNAWQWCRDKDDESFWKGGSFPLDAWNEPTGNERRALRGGSWYGNADNNFHCADRYRYEPTYHNWIVGFRAVASASPR